MGARRFGGFSNPKMPGEKATLLLEDGTAFVGRSFGHSGEVCAEVVFNTAMTA
jgi:carbamoylphosphate synthase small subunit